jgi:hypothetical protein
MTAAAVLRLGSIPAPSSSGKRAPPIHFQPDAFVVRKSSSEICAGCGKQGHGAALCPRVQPLSRLRVTIEAFTSFSERLQSLAEVRVALGLVTFSDEVDVVCPITDVLEQFKVDLEGVVAGGETSLFDGILQAVSMLEAYKAALEKAHAEARKRVHGNDSAPPPQPPPPKLRVIALTDGVDTQSSTGADQVARALQRSGVVLDAVVVCCNNFELPALARLSGGHALLPDSPEAAMAAFEADPMLLLEWWGESEPPAPIMNVKGVVRALARSQRDDWWAAKARVEELGRGAAEEAGVSADDVDAALFSTPPPPRALPPAGRCRTVAATERAIIDETLENATRPAISATSEARFGSSAAAAADSRRANRIKREYLQVIRDIAGDSRRAGAGGGGGSSGGCGFGALKLKVFLADDADVGVWRVLLEGPAGSPYAGRVFELVLSFPPAYPRAPPACRFATPIQHVNVDPASGRVCHYVLGSSWSSDTSVHIIKHTHLTDADSFVIAFLFLTGAFGSYGGISAAERPECR